MQGKCPACFTIFLSSPVLLFICHFNLNSLACTLPFKPSLSLKHLPRGLLIYIYTTCLPGSHLLHTGLALYVFISHAAQWRHEDSCLQSEIWLTLSEEGFLESPTQGSNLSSLWSREVRWSNYIFILGLSLFLVETRLEVRVDFIWFHIPEKISLEKWFSITCPTSRYKKVQTHWIWYLLHRSIPWVLFQPNV